MAYSKTTYSVLMHYLSLSVDKTIKVALALRPDFVPEKVGINQK